MNLLAKAATGHANGQDGPGLDELLRRGYRFALSLTHNHSRAEELVQDAWYSVLRANGPWSRTYLFSAIRSRFVDECRRRNLVGFESLRDGFEPTDDDNDARPEVDEGLIAANGSLDAALGQLRPEERSVLFLTAVEGFTAQQVAEMLDWPRGTVLSMKLRARRKLRTTLLETNRTTS